MRTSHSSRRRRAVILVAALVVLAAVSAALGGASASNAASSNPINVRPEMSGPQKATPGASDMFSCQARPISGTAGPRCYVPAQIQQAYGYSSLLAHGLDGSGRTIVIIDAYSNPLVPLYDLPIQDATFGLPAPNFSVVQQPNAVPPFDPTNDNQVGWAEEITLDVLWAHAMAPGAKIVLAEAASNNDADILATTKYVIDHNLGDVISQSFGEAEQCMSSSLLAEQHQLFAEAAAKGMTVFASSGDSGASQGDCTTGATPILAASTPASDPNVTGVGGTTLNATDPNGNYVGEKAWTEPLFGCNPPDTDDINCSGGGFSVLFPRPFWQPRTTGSLQRGVPDVSYNAGVNGGVLTHCAVCNITYPPEFGGPLPPDLPVFFIFGGTSAGSPQWAALTADADQLGHHRLGLINPSLYAAAHIAGALHDVTTGNNKVNDLGNAGYKATGGWDPVTGLGTPNAAVLLPALVALNSFH